MTLEVNVCESDLIDQNDYADWYCSRYSGWTCSEEELFREGEATNGFCKVRLGNRKGEFHLDTLTIEWEDGDEEDLDLLRNENSDWNGPAEDFDVTAFVWGVDSSSGEPINVLWGVS